MTVEQVVELLSRFGFPVFVAVFLLVRTDKVLREHTRATTEQTAAIRELIEEVKRGRA
jgi:hypothetical protein